MTKYTRVGTVISVGHNSPEGVAHGHSYEVWATYRFGSDARALLRQLETATKALDHTVLPDDISLGENLAEHIGTQLPGCIRVECNRPLERWGATWEPDTLARIEAFGHDNGDWRDREATRAGQAPKSVTTPHQDSQRREG